MGTALYCGPINSIATYHSPTWTEDEKNTLNDNQKAEQSEWEDPTEYIIFGTSTISNSTLCNEGSIIVYKVNKTQDGYDLEEVSRQKTNGAVSTVTVYKRHIIAGVNNDVCVSFLMLG